MKLSKRNCIWVSIIVVVLTTILCVILCLLIPEKRDEIVNKINEADQLTIIIPTDAQEATSEEKDELMKFFNSLVSCFFEDDVNTFNSMLCEEQMPWITLSQIDKYCASAYYYPSDVAENTYIKNGKLIEVSTETDPPEVEIGLSAALFGENSDPVFRESTTRTGFIEHASWYDADVEYINEHFDSIYDELAWTIEMNPDQSGSAGWSIYKLSNNTYIISNGISWYSGETCSREFAGKVFVVKRLNDEVYDNELKIVAFIDVI